MGRNDMAGGVTKPGKQNWIGLIARSKSQKIPFDEVLYIEQVGKYLLIHKDEYSIHVPGRISKISSSVGEPLFQCHSYLIVNISRVNVMTKGEIIFDNRMSTHLGERNYYKTRKKFNQYLLGE